MIGTESLPLRGHTLEGTADWARQVLSREGLDGSAYTLERHYEIPPHPVGEGAKFDARDEDLHELAAWFSNAAGSLARVRSDNASASEVRCWPHHFDIATLIIPADGKSVGVGLEPGDNYYDEPYFYVNMQPAPDQSALPDSLEDNGLWHTKEWIGAVLPASSLSHDAEEQERQVSQFLRSAVDTAIRIVTQA